MKTELIKLFAIRYENRDMLGQFKPLNKFWREIRAGIKEIKVI